MFLIKFTAVISVMLFLSTVVTSVVTSTVVICRKNKKIPHTKPKIYLLLQLISTVVKKEILGLYENRMVMCYICVLRRRVVAVCSLCLFMASLDNRKDIVPFKKIYIFSTQNVNGILIEY